MAQGRGASGARDPGSLLDELRLEEKAALTAGVDMWTTFPVPRLGIPPLRLSDGPAGAKGETRGIESLTPSACIPSGVALGASFDPVLTRQCAAVVARQAREKGAQVLLAPTLNLHRHPLWGRSFECFSEDPYLAARMGVAYLTGVQGEGVAATAKHFVGNETELERTTSSSEIEERTLHECYLLPFEHAVRAGVWALMTSYNRLNGRHLTDDERLLDGLLREEWGFEGVVMTDWFAGLHPDRAAAAGLDLEMPGPARSFGPALAAAVRDGLVKESDLDAKVRRLFRLAERTGALEATAVGRTAPREPPHHRERRDRREERTLLRQAAAGSLVLLANDGLLPLALSSLRRLALVGPTAARPAVMGGGSAMVTPEVERPLLAALSDRLAALTDPRPELLHEPGEGPAGIAAAVEAARAAEVVIVAVGTDHTIETEGHDRTSMDLPGDQDRLVREVLAANPRSVVVVSSGAPVTMGFAPEAGALLQAFFAGQEAGEALVDVLLGEADPGGRLPVTLPLRLEHTPAYGNFPGESSRVRYGEGLLIGYRYYEARHLPVAFPFGHGLSYTSFRLGPPRCSTARIRRGARLEVELEVTNTGTRPGTEVVQCYVAPPGSPGTPVGGRFRPPKELRAFAKVALRPGESTMVRLDLVERSFAYYDPGDPSWPELSSRDAFPAEWRGPGALHRDRPGWYVDPGVYTLHLGRSSTDIAHLLEVELEGAPDPLPGDAPLA